jgi:hypothetical protein
MTTHTKINQLLQNLPYGSVIYAAWLKEAGYSYSLQQSYRQSGWLSSIGKGVMVRSGQKLLLSGAVYALQQQAGLPVHIGGRTALGLLGFAHYLEVNRQDTLLFAPNGFNIPRWVINNQWDSSPQFIKTSFLPPKTGIISIDQQGFTLNISGAGRAMMECLEMAPAQFDLNEAWQIMQGLNLLPPATVQHLLTQCKSIKVKRLFLYLAHKADHSWFRKLRMDEIDLGSGKRSIVKNGVYVPAYKITLPENLL